MPALRKSRKVVAPGPFSFTYDEFEEWYENLRLSLLEPARSTFVRILNEALDQELSDLDRYRIRVSDSRIKSPARLWAKALKERYVEQIADVESIPQVIDDLIGIRVTCNNLSDIETMRNILAGLPSSDEQEMPAGLCIEPESEAKYNESPKETGYRAYHINLTTLVPAMNSWKLARAELQVRTLLQDSWGELTHEDTYKPGTSMPPIIERLARRMADILAAVDDLAQDLRNELDRLEHNSLQNDPDSAIAAATAVSTPELAPSVSKRSDTEGDRVETKPDDVRQALMSETRRIVDSLTKPASLAEVAHQVQANFGREVASSWGGLGSFKALLKTAVPSVVINESPPGFVVPASADAAKDFTVPFEEFTAPDGVPALVRRLHRHDDGLPQVASEKLSEVLRALNEVLTFAVWNELDISYDDVGLRELNRLSKEGRNRAAARDEIINRQWLDYMLKALMFTGNLRSGLSMASVIDVLTSWIFSRASQFGLVRDPVAERDELKEWFASASSDIGT